MASTPHRYARFADGSGDLGSTPTSDMTGLLGAVDKRLREEFGKLQVEINDENEPHSGPGRG